MIQSSFGTDLDAAFGSPLTSTTLHGAPSEYAGPLAGKQTTTTDPPYVNAQAPATVPTPQKTTFDNTAFNKQFDLYNQISKTINQNKLKEYIINHTQQQQQQQNAAQNQVSYMNKIITKKRDMLKLLVLAMMIIIAISIHSCVEYWLKDLVAAFELSYRQELGLRVFYPVIVIFIAWHCKTLMIKD